MRPLKPGPAAFDASVPLVEAVGVRELGINPDFLQGFALDSVPAVCTANRSVARAAAP